MSNTELYTKKSLPSKLLIFGAVVTLIGVAMSAIAFTADVQRASFGLIMALMLLISVGFGSLFLIALEYLVGADWSVPFRRITEIVAATSIVSILVAIPLLLNLHEVFTWLRPELLQADKYVAKKAPYLNESFFLVRVIIAFVIMLAFYFIFSIRSFKQDLNPTEGFRKLSAKFSALFMPVFAITISVIAMDWMMSLNPKWFSTIFGVYYFAGSVLASLAVVTFIAITLGENGYLSKKLTNDHYYNFGALMFAFTNFWAYIAFSQFLLIWYANIPDETLWFMDRTQGGWMVLSLILIFVKFAVPYFALLTRPSKGNPFRLRIIAVWVFLAHVYDMYWNIGPEYSKISGLKDPVYGIAEFAAPILTIGLIAVVFYFVGKGKNLMPVNDPKFKKSLDFHL